MYPKYILLCTLLFSFAFLCEDDGEAQEEDIERTNALATFQHFGDAVGCQGTNQPITFIVSYRDVQAFIDLDVGGTGFLTLLVEDGESVNVQVRIQNDDTVVADANVSVRTSSRPDGLEGEARVVTYCDSFDLIFSNF